jgi:DNA-binding MarR family transcriptional regulator
MTEPTGVDATPLQATPAPVTATPLTPTQLTTSEVTEAVRALSRLSRIVERASDELSGADYRVMAAIVSGEARATRLASRLALGKPAISSSIDSLSKRGLVVKSSVEGDNRAIALSLSEEGAELFQRMEARMARQLELLAERTPNPAETIAAITALGDVVEESMQAHARTHVSNGVPA